MRHLYLIRHGQASFGAANYDQLSDKGNEQSRLLGSWFKRCGIELHHAVAGGLTRHLQTAEAFFSAYGDPSGWMARPRRDPDFNEMDAGDVLNPANGERDSRMVPPTGGNAAMTFADCAFQFDRASRPYRRRHPDYGHLTRPPACRWRRTRRQHAGTALAMRYANQ